MSEIDWAEVRRACKRSKLGRATMSDQDLFSAAYAADPERYRKVHQEASQEAVEETFPWLAGTKKP